MSYSAIDPIFLKNTDDLLDPMKTFRIIQRVICHNPTDAFENFNTPLVQYVNEIRRKRKSQLSPAEHIDYHLL